MLRSGRGRFGFRSRRGRIAGSFLPGPWFLTTFFTFLVWILRGFLR
ncbi:MAG: hypothetical protein R3E53_04895 [Myxococcota bacterium]